MRLCYCITTLLLIIKQQIRIKFKLKIKKIKKKFQKKFELIKDSYLKGKFKVIWSWPRQKTIPEEKYLGKNQTWSENLLKM